MEGTEYILLYPHAIEDVTKTFACLIRHEKSYEDHSRPFPPFQPSATHQMSSSGALPDSFSLALISPAITCIAHAHNNVYQNDFIIDLLAPPIFDPYHCRVANAL